MAFILVSLLSAQDQIGALAILDSDSGLRYLQIDRGSSLIHTSHPRGVAVLNDLVYVTTPASLRIYRLMYQHKTALLQLQNEVILNEWLLGGPMQANLIALTVSKERNRIFIGNNNFCAIDELDLEGRFVRRRHLWEIAPKIFPLPANMPNTMNYGVIRNLVFSPDGSQYMTVANCNNSGRGKVINLETGHQQFSGLYDPHDGLFVDNLFYIHDVEPGKCLDNTSNGLLSVYRFPKKETGLSNVLQWSVKPEITRSCYRGSVQKLRGMAIADNTLFCGIRHFGVASGKQIRPRIVSFDANTGRQKKEYDLPDLVELRQPRVFSMATLPEPKSVQWSQDLHFFLNNKNTVPQYFREEIKAEAKEKEPVAETHEQSIGNDLPGDTSASTEIEQNNSVTTKTTLDKGNHCTKEEVTIIAEETAFTPAKEKVASVILEHVSLRYRRTGSSFFSLGHNKHLRQSKDFLALRDLSLTFYEEETVGLIGRNGSGKSTLSMMISGALPSDSGRVKTYGKVHLLALGVGFRPAMTGRDNVFISGTLLGLSRREVAGRMDEIKDFSELGDFFDEPLRTYSSGMRSRLGFAVATAVNPDILILDEVMSTGDAAFRKKADQRMQTMRKKTKTVIIVSHNANQLKKICTRVIWLEKGGLIMDGEAKSVLAKYNKFCQNPQKWLKRHAEKSSSLEGENTHALSV